MGAIAGALAGLRLPERRECRTQGAALGAAAGADGHLIPDEEAWYVADVIPEGSTATIILLEHLWAIPLRDAIVDAGGTALADEWIHARATSSRSASRRSRIAQQLAASGWPRAPRPPRACCRPAPSDSPRHDRIGYSSVPRLTLPSRRPCPSPRSCCGPAATWCCLVLAGILGAPIVASPIGFSTWSSRICRNGSTTPTTC